MSENAAEIPDDLVRRQDSPAAEPDSEPIAAHGEDLSDGNTHGVAPGGTERDASPSTRSVGDRVGTGVGGATSGAPSHPGYEIDPVVPPGRRSSPSTDPDDQADDAPEG